jgi:hypothetical protein
MQKGEIYSRLHVLVKVEIEYIRVFLSPTSYCFP